MGLEVDMTCGLTLIRAQNHYVAAFIFEQQIRAR